MLVQYIRLENLPQHIKCDFKDNFFDESKSNKHYASLKRNAKYKDTETYNKIVCLTFPNCIKFFVKYNDGTFSDTAFACYDWCTDTIYRFNTYCVSLSIDNELFEKTKESVINELFGR